jgi:hypothetical protein
MSVCEVTQYLVQDSKEQVKRLGFGVNDEFIHRFGLHGLPEEVFHLPTLQCKAYNIMHYVST